MALVDLATAREHLNLDSDIPDSKVTPKLNAAEAYFIGAVGADLSGEDYSADEYVSVKEVAKEAILMLMTQWYGNRSGSGKNEEPAYGVTNLIKQVQTALIEVTEE